MKILAIETSCDDTGIAVLEVGGKKFKVLANIVSSQKIHANYGGVFPRMAKREHQANLVPVLMQALKQAKLANSKSKTLWTRRDSRRLHSKQIQNLKKILKKENTLFENLKKILEKYEKPKVDAIAVTYGPGLEPCLWVGVNFAKALSYFWNIPVIPINHIEAHILVNFPDPKPYPLDPKKTFPAISLIVSGGHTQLILVKKIGSYKIIGETKDDAAGECFDKVARILGLGYPGGPAIAQQAERWKSQFPITHFQTNSNEQILKLPRPMMHSKDYDFSFSGLKTAVLYRIRDLQNRTMDSSMVLSEKFIGEMCVEVQQAIIDVLIKKTVKATKDFKAKTIILGGGVSANEELRKQFIKELEARSLKLELLIPLKELSTDNALMIAVAGYFHHTKKIAWQKLSVNANLRISK